MKKEVLIKITGLQEGEADVTLKAYGTCHFANGKHYIRYEEKADESARIVKNTLKISPEEIVLMKKGDKMSQMVFRPEEETDTLYQTPYGEITLKINTKWIKVQEAADSLKAALEYSLSAENAYLSDHKLTISIEGCSIVPPSR